MNAQIDLLSNGVRVGYARFYESDKEKEEQVEALKNAGCSVIYQEKKGEQFSKALNSLESGDTLVVWKLDRVGSSISHLVKIFQSLKDNNINFESLNEKIDTTTQEGAMYFRMATAFVEYENSLQKERTRIGLKAARLSGRLGGRKLKLDDNTVREANKLLGSGRFSMTDLARKYGVSRPTLYAAFKRLDS